LSLYNCPWYHECWFWAQKDNVLITAQMSSFGRSAGQIAILIDELLHNGVRLIFIKEDMELNGKRNIQSKIMITIAAGGDS
jgi:DNA invertase Pin-like site-specific DNA recombinase